MTREERNTKLKHFITCLKCEVSGKECDDNCPVQYEAGNMGEIIENLEAISKALEQEPCEDTISREDVLLALTGEWTELTDEIIHRFIKRIKALPPVNPQPCEDCISRQAAIDALGEKPLAWVEGEYELGLQNQWENDVNAIKTLLPAQPKVGALELW